MTDKELIEKVKYDPEYIKRIKNPSEAVQLAAVSEDPYAIEYIKNPTESVQLAAASENAYVIQYIENPIEAVQLLAIEEDEELIKYIKNPTAAVQLAAVKKDEFSIIYIKKPCSAVLEFCNMNCNVEESTDEEDDYENLDDEELGTRNLFPNSGYEFIDKIHTSIETIKEAFEVYGVNDYCDFFNFDSLDEAFNFLKSIEMIDKGWKFDSENGTVAIDIRKIDIENALLELKKFAEFYTFDMESDEPITQFERNIYVDEQFYLLPSISNVPLCPDGYGDYLVFEYDDELYVLTMLCFE